MNSNDDHHAEGGNRATVAAVIFVVLIVVGCVWLFERLGRANDELNCVAAGRRNCEQLNR